MTDHTMPVLTEEKRQALIYEAKFLIENHGGNLEELLKIALASLEAEPKIVRLFGAIGVDENCWVECEDDEEGATQHYTAPPVPALKLPGEWTFCPECGSEEIHYEDGNHKQCANCHQEWHSHINYSRAVKLNLQEFFRKANQQPVPALNLPNYVETSPGADRVRQAVNDVWNRCIDEVKRLNGVTE